MQSLIILIALLVAVLAGLLVEKFVAIADPSVAKRLENVDEPAVQA